MANCPKCGSTMVHFKNPDRDVCPTPDRHLSRAGAGATARGKANKGQKRPQSSDNLKKKKK